MAGEAYPYLVSFHSKLLPFLSLILYDIKLMNPEEHLLYTGRENQIILSRIPLIPNITTKPENLQAISEFIRECGLTQCWFLPYKPLELSKRGNLGKEPIDVAEISHRDLFHEEIASLCSQ